MMRGCECRKSSCSIASSQLCRRLLVWSSSRCSLCASAHAQLPCKSHRKALFVHVHVCVV